MTTVIGIKTNDGTGTIVLAADRQVTIEENEKPTMKRTNFRKLYHNRTQQFAFGFSGLINDNLTDFYEHLMAADPQKILHTLKGKVFKEVRELNIKNAIGKEQKDFDENSTSSFVFGTRDDNLYLVHPMGAIEPAKFVAIGSGSGFAEAFLEKEIDDNSIARKPVDTKEAIEMAVGALRAANNDVSTSGVDITIISHRGIRNYGDEISAAMEEAKKKKISEIIRHYKKKPKKKPGQMQNAKRKTKRRAAG